MKTMKSAKKLFALVLALVMAMALSVTAFAADITINNAVDEQTYTAYKLFDVTNSGDAYAYTTTNDTLVSAVQSAVQSGTLSGITFTATTTSGTYNVTVDEETFNAANFAAWISENLDSLNLTSAGNATGSSGTATIENVGTG